MQTSAMHVDFLMKELIKNVSIFLKKCDPTGLVPS